jgi:hypothetical protein
MYKLRRTQLCKWIPINKIHWHQLSANESEGAIRLLEANPDKINWYYLSLNSSEGAIRLLEANQDQINWSMLSLNKSEGAIRLLQANPDMNRKEPFAFFKPIQIRLIGTIYQAIHLFFNQIGIKCEYCVIKCGIV